METRAHYVLIGSFALAVTAAAFLFILWLGPGGIDREFDEYDVVFNDPVTGLTVGGAVRFNGIAVGEVTELSLDPDDPNQVVARIRVAADTPVKVDTIAQLEFAGLTGLSFIQFTGGATQSDRLKDVQSGVPRIAATPSEVQRLFAEGGDIIDSANTAVLAIARILNDENVSNVEQTIENIRILTDVFSENSSDIETVVRDVAAATRALNEASADIARITAAMTSVADKTEDIFEEDVDAILSDTRALVAETNALVADNRAALSEFSQEGLPEATLAMAEMRELITSLERLSSALERDPSRFLFGQSYPEYRGGDE